MSKRYYLNNKDYNIEKRIDLHGLDRQQALYQVIRVLKIISNKINDYEITDEQLPYKLEIITGKGHHSEN